MKKLNVAPIIIRMIIIVIGLPYLSMSCSSRIRMQKFLEKDKVRSELYSVILNDHRFLGQFMDSMTMNNHARMMVREDKAFLNAVMDKSDLKTMMECMMKKVENDSVQSKQMCLMMVEHKKAMESMMETMQEKGILDKGGLKKGNEKTGDPENHKEHH
jgi:sensor c-di-GMP phosphodiesterase-like protein